MKTISRLGLLFSMCVVGVGHAEEPKDLSFEECSLLVQGTADRIEGIGRDGNNIFIRRDGDFWSGRNKDPNAKISSTMWMMLFGPEMSITAEQANGSTKSIVTKLKERDLIQSALMAGVDMKTECHIESTMTESRNGSDTVEQNRLEGTCEVSNTSERTVEFNGCKIPAVDFQLDIVPTKAEKNTGGQWTNDSDLTKLFVKGTVLKSMPLVVRQILDQGVKPDFDHPRADEGFKFITQVE